MLGWVDVIKLDMINSRPCVTSDKLNNELQTCLDVEIGGNFARKECPLCTEVSKVANVGDQRREVAINVQGGLWEVKDAHGSAPILVDIRPAVDPVHVLVPAAKAEVTAGDDLGGEVPICCCSKSWGKLIH